VKARQNQVFIEFKEGSVHVLDGPDGAEFPLERESTGKMTASSKAALANGLRGFLQRNGVLGQRRAVCALPARGVTFRTITLPPGVKKEDATRLLAMQIEAQFPVAPSELAWGCTPIPGNGSENGSKAQAEFLVAAVKRELIEDYHALQLRSAAAIYGRRAGAGRGARRSGKKLAFCRDSRGGDGTLRAACFR
jgi:hypothetical protein